ncbi:AAA family ATPase [Lentzea sp. NEAU-D7]|uniref:AAA family ATPase n=1 Tax=Lentzea sp. NEAU-D7 TaxID=2994667 RepID=UPI00224AFAB8|nr:AAA family ATPase [Lentzea sp. NEAU-D7]MCX2949755.1 AAA family ATPase [Lentzea sp. NEAU-D7]
MSGVQHLSMRVPWRDRAWDQFVCDDPLGNSSCTLLANIGPNRDDSFEAANASAGIDTLDQDRLPCLSERATFMSPLGYTVMKTHPYAWNRALKGKIHPTPVSLPGYAFEAVPFRWLNRTSLAEDIGASRVPAFNPTAEDHVDDALGFDGASWVMDGHNQRALLDAFFASVVAGDSLVFIYLKHSPLQEQRTDRLLVGAARVTGVTLPPMWKQTGHPPFNSSMWETIVEHSLRPDMVDGILLPYQKLIPLLDDGVDVDKALAWAPEGRDVEFSYVTEHLSDDAAIEALASLQQAALGMRALDIEVPDTALCWISTQTERLWQVRGPVPGLPAALAYIGVAEPYVAARAVVDHVGETDPWPFLEGIFADPGTAPDALRSHLPRPIGRIWSKLPAEHQAVLQLLSALDIAPDQVKMLMDGKAEVETSAEELLENPYFAATCTYTMPEHVPFSAVDRALFPPTYVTWTPAVPDEIKLEGPLDRRRIEALLTDVLERQGRQGDTVVPQSEAIELANSVNLSQPPNLTQVITTGLDLDHDSLVDRSEWSPLTSVPLANGSSAYKLTRYENTSDVIRDWIAAQESHTNLGVLANARKVLDEALDRNQQVTTTSETTHSELEERARTEKAAGLSALHNSSLSVLIGPAGTGKTTLLRALVEHPGVDAGGVLLLAPTGKAKVQLDTKVGLTAKTLASYLTTTDRYDGDTGRYLVWGDQKPRQSFGLVVIDEASMLTEEMLAATLDSFTGVKRLVLVGDPKQLPPIGAGRPFVDLVNKLRPTKFADWLRVAPGYVELQVPRRQLPDGGIGTRHDLELAAWFGDGVRGAADDDIWTVLAADPNQATVRYESWGDRSAVQALTDVMQEELALDGHLDQVRAFACTYGGTINGEYLNWEPGAGSAAENWQILSPTRSRAFGTVELNRHIKRTYRTSDTRFAQRTYKSNIAAPIGPELIVRGDKVMQTINRRLKAYPADGGLNYVANGEIGVGIGRTPAAKRPKKALAFNVEYSSQPGFQYSYWPTSREDVQLELAWAVTVHKSQGSEFGITFLVLPARTNVSRELMYTAMTRQRDKVVILHEGTLADLRDLAQPWRSETSRRLTDLFTAPEPVSLKLRGEARRYDRKLIHVSADGTPMASKNEVIIAGLLDQLVPGQWEYEKPYIGNDGREVLPDFTIATADGRTVFWEHAGMLDLPDYARKWELKKAWYTDNRVLPHSDGGGPNGILLWTDDRKGADAQAWLALAAEVLGVDSTTVVSGGHSGTTTRRVSKKVPTRRR